MLQRIIVTLMLAGLATVAAAETVYKWVDRSGQMHYTDLPPNEPGARILDIYEREQILATANGPAGQQDAGSQDGGASQDGADGVGDAGAGFDPAPGAGDDGAAAAAAAVQRDLDQARSEQCQKAQERYRTYIESRRLFRQTPDGKREYLTDAEISAARIQAKQDVDSYCQ
jgi:hypothetical protein